VKKILIGASLALLLSACGNTTPTIKEDEDEKAKAKTEESAASSSEEKKETKTDDAWTYYENAKWSNDYNGLKSEITKVVVSDKIPRINDDGDEVKSSAVGLKFKIENTTTGKFTTYPDQATLVTSTGEQVDADMFVSDSIGGEIDKGVIKEGNVIFYLERGEAEKIAWIKVSWDERTGPEDSLDSDPHTNEVELKLK
jgi:ABC-type oligopeptide transport system substrate-binding subunit